MAKEFYTERDIEDLFRRGIRSLAVSDEVVLTELAYEKANKLGMQLAKTSFAAQPVTPPVSQDVKTVAPCACKGEPAKPGDLHGRIREAVNAKLGSAVDPQLLEVIITRVLKATGAK